MNIQEALLEKIDISYSYELAKKMESNRSNEALGYRTAGSKAEYETGELLHKEMIRIGLQDVRKDAITVDGWEFKKAVLTYQDTPAPERTKLAEAPSASQQADSDLRQTHSVLLGAYQTHFVTNGAEEFQLIYAGKGTAHDYDGLDVKGKLVLIEINQRDEWWINYPVYQAHLKGAKAVIAVQSGGYGEIDEEALNAQDIAGPENAPAFSISREDASGLMSQLTDKAEITVTLEADTQVKRDVTTYNITGCIPGRHPERIVLMTAHYDSYFDGFQDDNTAVAMMFGIMKAYLDCGYQPQNTLMICAMAAEEWGVADSNFDWSTGAYEQVFTAHPEWVGHVIADLNFELPALAHGTRARIRSCYEYTRFLNNFLLDLPNLIQAYPEETKVTAPIETWSDDFSIAIAGIPSMVNDFTGGSFMETHYHSQFDNDNFYDEHVYELHHQLYALLIEALDRTAVVPLCFTPVFKRAFEIVEEDIEFVDDTTWQKLEFLNDLLHTAQNKARSNYEEVLAINAEYNDQLNNVQEQSDSQTQLSAQEQADALFLKSRPLEQELLRRFKLEQDTFVRIDWYGNVLYPHEILIQDMRLVSGTIRNLQNHNLSSALRKLYQLDNNAYAFNFDEEVYNHFSNYVYNQPKERLKWGYQRLMEHENMYHIVTALLEKEKNGNTDCQEELAALELLFEKQQKQLLKTIDDICQIVATNFIL